jgi:hypothetical protein
VPPEAEPIEDPQTPGLMTKPPEHPLQHSWCVPVRVGCEELPISPEMLSYLLTACIPLYILKDYISRHKVQGAVHATDILG